MGRKTNFSAFAFGIAGIASFGGLDSAQALAQGSLATLDDATQGLMDEPESEEIVPVQVVFVSREVAQDVPETPEPAPVPEAKSLRELVDTFDHGHSLSDQMHCLTGAIYFESRGEPLAGQLAVANVVINRSEDRRWPASYCGVVYQRSQFSFVKKRRMPRVDTGSAAWKRASAIARIAHQEMWESPASEAVYFHATHVKPRWSRAKTRLAQIDTHVFYR